MTTSHAPTLLAELPPADHTGGPPARDGWTEAAVDRYVAALPGLGRTLLSTILASAPCPTDRAQAAAGLGDCEYAEAHACLEEALFAVPGVVRLPFDVVDGCFTVDRGVAPLVRAALARP